MTVNGGRNQGKKKRLNAEAFVFALLSLLSFSALLFATRSFIVDFKGIGLTAFSGVRGGIYEISSFISRSVLSIRELAALRREYAELADRITRYEQLERTLAEIDQENQRLREQLGFSRTIRYRHIPAEIIGRDPDNLFKAFAINKGKYSGVANNMAVIAFHGGAQGLVGKVIEAGQFESLVMPLYDVSCSVAARLSASRYDGLVEGQGSPDEPLMMRFIQKRARDEINYGDLIVSSGLGGVYPPGINIGRITGVSFRENEISMEAALEPVIDFSRLEYVFVIESQREEDG
jgi:rod shape-determining protein MreC